MQNLKKILAVAVATTLLFTLLLPASQVFGKHIKTNYWKPFTQVLDEEDEDEGEDEGDEECPPEECGEDEEEEVATPVCTKDTWSCGAWEACSAEGSQTRSCKLTYDCKTTTAGKPAVSQKCTAPVATPPPEPECTADKWTCGSWSACSDTGSQSRTCKLSTDCKTAETPSPGQKQACEPPEKVEEKPVPPPPPTEDETALKEKQAAAAAKAAQDAAAAKAAQDAAAAKAAQDAAAAKATEDARLKADEDNQRKAAEEETAKLKAEEEAKKAEEEAKLKAEEEIRKAAEESARQQAKADLLAKEAEAKARQAEVARVIKETPAFQEIIQNAPVSTVQLMTDINGNGVPDNIEQSAGINTKKVNEELIQFKADLAVREDKLVKEEGKSQEEATKIVAQELKKKKVEQKVDLIREVAQKKHRIKIENSKQDTNGDGVSDEAEILLGLNPKEVAVPNAAFSSAEKKFYGIDAKKDPKAAQRCTTSIASGTRLASDGFTVLAACPKNETFTLFAVDQNGKEIPLETKKSSENGKMIFAGDKKLPEGNYLIQIRPVQKAAATFPSFAWFASTLNPPETPPVESASAPVVVDLVSQTDVPEPEVQRISDIEIEGLQDIRVTPTADGKIRVTGLADISTMVVGTFSSAIFTSAILADVSTGSFEVLSPRTLEGGGHEVVVYASRPEDSTQSKPVMKRFQIVQKGESLEVVSERPAAQEKGFPMVWVLAIGGAAVLFIGIGIFMKKNKGG